MMLKKEKIRHKAGNWIGCAVASIMLLGIAPLVSGCGKGGASSTGRSQADVSSDPLGIAALKDKFSSADPVVILGVDDTVAEIRAQHFKSAIERLQNLSKRPGLTDEQQKALRDMIAKLESMDAGQSSGTDVPK